MTQSKTQSEPPERRTNNVFLVGRDSRGHWVVQDERGLCGGLFADCSKAIRFAMDETRRQPQAIRMVPGVLELDMSRTAAAFTPPHRSTATPRPNSARPDHSQG